MGARSRRQPCARCGPGCDQGGETQGRYRGRSVLHGAGQAVIVRSRADVESQTLRRPDILPPAEIMVAIIRIVEENYGAEPDQLVQAVARLFGFGATSAQLREVVEGALTELIESNRLRLDGRLVTRAHPEPVIP